MKEQDVPFAVLTFNDLKVTIVCTKITPESIIDAIRLTGQILAYTKDALKRGNPHVETNLIKK